MENMMASAADKKRWDKLKSDYAKARDAYSAYEFQLRSKYGPFQISWLTRTEARELAQLRDRMSKIDDKIIDLLVRVSPRGEAWLSGTPSWWLLEKLTWEDAIRPADEPLSVVVPGSYGYPDGYVKETRKRMAQEVDFYDEDAVLAEVASDLELPVGDLSIDTDAGLSGFRAGDVYEITITHGRHGKSWGVVEDEDVFHDLAIAIVTQDLEEDPSIFSKSFIESHINMDRLRDDLYHDVLNSRIDDLTYVAEQDPDDFWADYERAGFDVPEEDADGDRRAPASDEIEELAENQTEDELRDPMAYLEGIYGDEASAQAIAIAGIDVNSAAEDAVQIDGPAHFVARYDGNYETTESGFVYWRST